MKNIFTSFTFFFLILLFACKDNNEINNPDWVDNWIAEIESDQYCTFCEIYRYEFEGVHYYELYSPIFSCFPCQVHDGSGVAVDSTFNIQDYIENRKHKKVIYKKE